MNSLTVPQINEQVKKQIKILQNKYMHKVEDGHSMDTYVYICIGVNK